MRWDRKIVHILVEVTPNDILKFFNEMQDEDRITIICKIIDRSDKIVMQKILEYLDNNPRRE